MATVTRGGHISILTTTLYFKTKLEMAICNKNASREKGRNKKEERFFFYKKIVSEGKDLKGTRQKAPFSIYYITELPF